MSDDNEVVIETPKPVDRPIKYGLGYVNLVAARENFSSVVAKEFANVGEVNVFFEENGGCLLVNPQVLADGRVVAFVSKQLSDEQYRELMEVQELVDMELSKRKAARLEA